MKFPLPFPILSALTLKFRVLLNVSLAFEVFSHILELISCFSLLRCKTVQTNAQKEHCMQPTLFCKDTPPNPATFGITLLSRGQQSYLNIFARALIIDMPYNNSTLFSVFFQHRIVSFYLLAVRQLHLFKSNCSMSSTISNCSFYSFKKQYVFIKETSSSVPLLFLLHFSNLYINQNILYLNQT